MTKKDMPEFIKILTGLAAMFDRPLTALIRDMYFTALSGLTIEQINTAGNQLARTATFFPKPVDFINAIQGNIETATIGAWEKVLKAKSKAGQYQSVQFNDPVIHSTIKLMGGWVSLCRLEGHDDEKWQRIEFEKIYKAMQGLNKDHPVYLPGLSEIDNEARGIEYKNPVVMIAAQAEKKALPPVERKALPEPEKILSKKEITKRIEKLDIGIREVIESVLPENDTVAQ